MIKFREQSFIVLKSKRIEQFSVLILQIVLLQPTVVVVVLPVIASSKNSRVVVVIVFSIACSGFGPFDIIHQHRYPIDWFGLLFFLSHFSHHKQTLIRPINLEWRRLTINHYDMKLHVFLHHFSISWINYEKPLSVWNNWSFCVFFSWFHSVILRSQWYDGNRIHVTQLRCDSSTKLCDCISSAPVVSL